METGTRTLGPASLRVRQCSVLPVDMRATTREIASVHVPFKEQRKGYATSLMHKVCREADKAGIVLVLWPQPYGDDISMHCGQLVAWYEEFGFVEVQPEPVTMARQPKSPAMFKLNSAIEAVIRG